MQLLQLTSLANCREEGMRSNVQTSSSICHTQVWLTFFCCSFERDQRILKSKKLPDKRRALLVLLREHVNEVEGNTGSRSAAASMDA